MTAQRRRGEAALTNAKYATRDVLIPELGYLAIERVLEDGETREEIVRRALGSTEWTKRLTPEERDLVEIRGFDPKGAEGFELTLGDGTVWTINVSASRIR
jgi:hypothetical protein